MRKKINMKQTIITILLVLVAMAGQGQDTILWERPAIGYSNISYFEVQKVELTKERTAMHVCVSLMPGYKFHIKKESFLQTNGKQYEIIGSDGITLDGNYITLDDTGMKNFVLWTPRSLILLKEWREMTIVFTAFMIRAM